MARDPSTLVSAALRHVRDAELLLDTSHGRASPDQAFHLAGFGPECARKATLSVDWFDKALGHEMGQRADSILRTAIDLDPLAARYEIVDWSIRVPAIAQWNETVRYEKTGSRTAEQARMLVEQAREVVDGLALALWMDGRLPKGVV